MFVRSVERGPDTPNHKQPVCSTKASDAKKGLWRGYPWKVVSCQHDLGGVFDFCFQLHLRFGSLPCDVFCFSCFDHHYYYWHVHGYQVCKDKSVTPDPNAPVVDECGNRVGTTVASAATTTKAGATTTKATTTVAKTVATASKPAATKPAATPKSGGSKDKHIVAYIPNWVACPSASQLQYYTHAMVAFAVTYPRYVSGGDNCGSVRTCTVQKTPGCGGKTLKKMTSDLQAMGLKVILSFGGAGMGGSWSSSQDTCWEYCLDKVDSLVDQLDAAMVSSGADGLDIDYEYLTEGSKYQKFLTDLVVKLHKKMGGRVLLTHAPMDVDLCEKSLDGLCRPHYSDVLKARSEPS